MSSRRQTGPVTERLQPSSLSGLHSCHVWSHTFPSVCFDDNTLLQRESAALRKLHVLCRSVCLFCVGGGGVFKHVCRGNQVVHGQTKDMVLPTSLCGPSLPGPLCPDRGCRGVYTLAESSSNCWMGGMRFFLFIWGSHLEPCDTLPPTIHLAGKFQWGGGGLFFCPGPDDTMANHAPQKKWHTMLHVHSTLLSEGRRRWDPPWDPVGDVVQPS